MSFKLRYVKKSPLGVYRKRRRRAVFCLACTVGLLVVFLSFYFLYFIGGKTAAQSKVQSEVIPDIDEKILELYPAFCSVGPGVSMFLPVEIFNVLGIGYHQAESENAFNLIPLGEEAKVPSGEKIKLKGEKEIKGITYFVMNSRGRETSRTSAADIAVSPNAWIKSPVDGVVTKIKTYLLYGKYSDFHIEIEPSGHPELRVVLIHLDDLDVSEGDKVKAKETLLGKVRHFGDKLNSQIENYIPKKCDHVHLQVNKYLSEDG